MEEMKFVYGPVPSRRLGISLGISPIPKKTCNYSCIYCQLGRTDNMTNTRQMFFSVKEIIEEFDIYLKRNTEFDVVTIVGEGEPTLYLGLGKLICEVKKRTEKPVVVITNGALLYDKVLREELYNADIVLPTLDAYDDASLKSINRPHGAIRFEQIKSGLKTFSEEFIGSLWIEIMLIPDMNDDNTSLLKLSEILKTLKYDKVYINTPVRPPAEANVKSVSHECIERAVNILGGISIELLASQGFYSEIKDHYEAIISIIKRHPMNQFEIESFLKTRGCIDSVKIMNTLKQDEQIALIEYKGMLTYRLK
ncbi:radical SAM protein [Fusibacter bizertensis]|uniref:Radical SAM protein n=1 Tax=Fusibacter bizertensis TaxID=1488331 RepID=A0ABT6NGE1_9FIRM|nr:radical SAM protein [Fusibacter bizertensis]MDH8679494.1 radical SAM protein [Fusibacter bizertensis]